MSHAEESAHHDPRKAYYLVFGALMVATALTVGAAWIDLGRGVNIALGLLIATTKACLVALIFMHLKGEEKFLFAVMLFPLVLFLVLVLLLLPDVGLSSWHDANPFDDPKSPHYKPPPAAEHP